DPAPRRRPDVSRPRPTRSSTEAARRRSSRAKTSSGSLNRLGRVRTLIVGSGGREHALAWALSRSAGRDELHAAPGNPGIAQLGTCHPVRAEDTEGLLALAR